MYVNTDNDIQHLTQPYVPNTGIYFLRKCEYTEDFFPFHMVYFDENRNDLICTEFFSTHLLFARF